MNNEELTACPWGGCRHCDDGAPFSECLEEAENDQDPNALHDFDSWEYATTDRY